MPMNFERFHSPRFTLACASGMLRQSASSIAIVCSVADMMFAVGALMTRMPRAVQASTSTLSSPTPARPTIRSRVPAFTSSSVTAVPLRVISASDSRDRAQQRVAFESGPVVELDVARGAEDRQAGIGERVGDEDAVFVMRVGDFLQHIEHRVQIVERDVAHVADAEGRVLPLAVAAAERVAALLHLGADLVGRH